MLHNQQHVSLSADLQICFYVLSYSVHKDLDHSHTFILFLCDVFIMISVKRSTYTAVKLKRPKSDHHP